MIKLSNNIYTLTQDTVYALPTNAARVAVFTAAGTLQVSMDNVHFQSITLDANSEFDVSAKFIKSIDDDSIVSIKRLRSL